MKEIVEQKLAYGPMSALRTKPEAQGAVAASNSVGPLLCATRMRVGKDLQDVARLLHIRYNYLVAIEDGRFEDLPGQAYAIGFVRAYAEHLGLDGAEIVRRFKGENSGVQQQSIQNYAVPAPASGVPSGVLLSIAVVMGMLVYGAWYSFAGADRRAADLIQEIPDRLAVLLAPDPSTALPSPIPGDVADAPPVSDAATVTAMADPGGIQVAAPDSEVTASTADDEPGENETTAEMAVAEALPTPPAIVPKSEPPAAPRTAPELAQQTTPQVAAPVTVQAAPQISLATVAAPSVPVKEVAAPVVEIAKPAPAVTESKQAEPQQPVPEVVTAKVEAPKVAAPRADQPATDAPAPTAAPAPTPTRIPAPTAVAVQAPPPTPTPSPAAPPAAGRETQVAALPPPAAAAPPAKPSANPSTNSSGDVIELRANSDSWIQVRAGDQLLLTRLLRKGEIYRVPDRTGLTLMTGNAGGLDVMVNGTTMPPLGNESAVALGVPLEASRLKTMAAASEPVPDSDESDAD